jgi:hypothetical protein
VKGEVREHGRLRSEWWRENRRTDYAGRDVQEVSSRLRILAGSSVPLSRIACIRLDLSYGAYAMRLCGRIDIFAFNICNKGLRKVNRQPRIFTQRRGQPRVTLSSFLYSLAHPASS